MMQIIYEFTGLGVWDIAFLIFVILFTLFFVFYIHPKIEARNRYWKKKNEGAGRELARALYGEKKKG